MSKRRKLFLTTFILFIIAIVYTLLVMKYDVQSIGPKNSSVGFAGINGLIHNALPYNEFWYKITKYLGIVPFLYCLFYGIQGIMQIIKYKSLKRVDKRLIYLGVFIVAFNKRKGLLIVLAIAVAIDVFPIPFCPSKIVISSCCLNSI